MRLKTALITRTPLKSLCNDDFRAVQQLDPRYLGLLGRTSDQSWHQIRGTIKPYLFTITNSITTSTDTLSVLAKTKQEAWKQLSKDTRKNVVKIQVEYETYVKDLKCKRGN